MTELNYVFERNATWSDERTRADAGYFTRLSALQAPRLFWIGCSDSRVPANVISGLEPGEVFVHRNVGNLVYAADLNCMSVLQYAVEALRVEHVIVCGHYGCGAVRVALGGGLRGLIDHWLEPIRELARSNAAALARLPDDDARQRKLCELNVQAQVQNVAHSPIVQQAWAQGRRLSLHGWIYGLDNGRLHDLNCGCAGCAED